MSWGIQYFLYLRQVSLYVRELLRGFYNSGGEKEKIFYWSVMAVNEFIGTYI
jgi:hypothetical protein